MPFSHLAEAGPVRGLLPLIGWAVAGLALTLWTAVSAQAAPVELVEVRISAGSPDAAPIPATQVIRHFGWAEQEFAKVGARVVWTRDSDPAGALSFVATGETDFAAAPLVAALDARLAGAPLRGVALLSRDIAEPARREILLVTRERFAAAHPEAAARLIRLHERAAAWIRANPDEAARLFGATLPARTNPLASALPSLVPGERDAAALKSLAGAASSRATVVDIAHAIDALLGVDNAIKAYQPPIDTNPILAALR